MTDTDRIDQIRARTEAAPAGPWGFFDGTDSGGYIDIVADYQPTGRGSFSCRRQVARLEVEDVYDDSADEDMDEGDAAEVTVALAEFVSNARADVPWLLDQLAAVTADRDRLQQELDAAQAETHIVTDDSEDPEHADDCPGREPIELHVTGVSDIAWRDDGDVEVYATATDGRPVMLRLTEGQAAELRDDLADGDVTHAIADAIRDFPWAVYGLDEVQHAPTEWIGDLASAIAGALPDDNPDEHDLGITDRDETAVA